MSILTTAILQRIKQLGGESTGTADTLEASLGLITLPSLFTDESLFEDFDDRFEDESRATLKRILDAPRVDYTKQVLPVLEEIAKVFYFRNQPSSNDLTQWDLDESDEEFIVELSGASDLRYMEIGYGQGWHPDLYNIFLSDPKPNNPIVYSTDHEVSWRSDSVAAVGTLEEFLNEFLTPQEVMDGIRTEIS